MGCIFTTHLNLVLYCFSIPRKGENKEEEKKEKKREAKKSGFKGCIKFLS